MEYKCMPEILAIRLTEVSSDVLNDACMGGARAFPAGGSVLWRGQDETGRCFPKKQKERNAGSPLLVSFLADFVSCLAQLDEVFCRVASIQLLNFRVIHRLDNRHIDVGHHFIVQLL